MPDPIRKFPLQCKELHADSRTRQPIEIPWDHAEEAYKYYVSRYGDQQSLARLAERGGFGAAEIVMLLIGRIHAMEYELKRIEFELKKARPFVPFTPPNSASIP